MWAELPSAPQQGKGAKNTDIFEKDIIHKAEKNKTTINTLTEVENKAYTE